MKKLFFTLMLAMFHCFVFAQDVEYAVKYNDRIVDLNLTIIKSLDNLMDSYDYYIPEEMDSLYKKALVIVNSGIQKI